MRRKVTEDWQFFNAAVMLRGLFRLAMQSGEAANTIRDALNGGHRSPRQDGPGNTTTHAGHTQFEHTQTTLKFVDQMAAWTRQQSSDNGAQPQGDVGGHPGPQNFQNPQKTQNPSAGSASSIREQAPTSAPPRRFRWLNLLIIGLILVLAVVWYTMLTRPQDPPPSAPVSAERSTMPKDERAAPRATPAPTPPRVADGSFFVSVHRGAYEHGEVTTFWFFESQQATLPIRQLCNFYPPAQSGEGAGDRPRSFEIEQRPGGRQPSPGYMATGLTLSEWNRAADACQWHGAASGPRRRETPARRT